MSGTPNLPQSYLILTYLPLTLCSFLGFRVMDPEEQIEVKTHRMKGLVAEHLETLAGLMPPYLQVQDVIQHRDYTKVGHSF